MPRRNPNVGSYAAGVKKPEQMTDDQLGRVIDTLEETEAVQLIKRWLACVRERSKRVNGGERGGT